MLPRRVHHAIDPELERGLRGVSHMLGISKDVGTRCLIVNQHGFARYIELVATRLRLGKGLKSVLADPQKIVPFRGGRGEQHQETTVGEDGAIRMGGRGTVVPLSGALGRPNYELVAERP